VAPADAGSQARPTILVVDDDARNRTLLRAYLEDGGRILEAVSGAEALQLLEGESIDLVLVDVMMPGMSGYELCREIKKRASGEVLLPVLMLTALTAQESRNAGLEAGADDFLQKPANRHELRLRVSAFLKLREQDRLIRRQVEELRQLDALKDDLVSLMVHDLRNPLAAVLAELDVLRREIPDEELRAGATSAHAAAARLREIVDDILQVRLLEEGELTLSLQSCLISDIVREAVAGVEPVAHERGVSVALALNGGPPAAVDRKLVRRAVENILANAIKYSPPLASVEVQTRAAEGGIEVAVADRGPGIPDALRSRLFEKFGSVEAARGEARRGYGLGLYLVRLVASAHGGRAVAQNRDGGGSVFGLWLPAHDPARSQGVSEWPRSSS
jgi:signal transduction histidine kinase